MRKSLQSSHRKTKRTQTLGRKNCDTKDSLCTLIISKDETRSLSINSTLRFIPVKVRISINIRSPVPLSDRSEIKKQKKKKKARENSARKTARRILSQPSYHKKILSLAGPSFYPVPVYKTHGNFFDRYFRDRNRFLRVRSCSKGSGLLSHSTAVPIFGPCFTGGEREGKKHRVDTESS